MKRKTANGRNCCGRLVGSSVTGYKGEGSAGVVAKTILTFVLSLLGEGEEIIQGNSQLAS
jgi:hypothetical protein